MKKLIDERGLLFGRISVVDILAVLVVLLLGVMVYTRFFSGGEADISDTGSVRVEYEMRISGVRQFTVDAIKPGDAVYESENGTALGTVTDVRTESAVKKVETADGRVVLAENPGYYDIWLTLSADCSESGGRYYIGGTFELLPNAECTIRTLYAATTGRIVSVNE